MKKDERIHFRRIAELGCILCYTKGNAGTPCEIHHIRRAGQRKKAPVIGLCPFHHRYDTNTSIHGAGRKAFERNNNTTEEALLELTERLLNEQNY